MGKTLNEYIERLKPVQQDFIVWCVQEYSDRVDFHRGLLPFLDAHEASRCLKFKLEAVKQDVSKMNALAGPSGLSEAPVPVIGEKFIRSIISIFEDALVPSMYEDEASQDMQLNTGKLAAEYGRRFSKKFCVTLGPGAKNGLVQLEMLPGRNYWRVTTHKGRLDEATTWLAETCR